MIRTEISSKWGHPYEKSIVFGDTGVVLFRVYVCSEPEYESGRGILAVERSAPLLFYAAHHVRAAVERRTAKSCYAEYSGKYVFMAFVEYCWFRTVLCAAFRSVGFCRGLVYGGHLLQSFLVALFSGVIATILFFQATDLVKDNPKQLAVIEATQSGEVIFTLLLSVLVLGDAMPTWIGFVGISLVIVGMILNSLATK